MVCLRNISVDTLHKGDTEDNNNNNNNNIDNNTKLYVIYTMLFNPMFSYNRFPGKIVNIQCVNRIVKLLLHVTF
jgi:hypothetical protein